MNKKVLRILLVIGSLYFGVLQYKFNTQVEWWAMAHGLSERCTYWDAIIPAAAKAQLATKEITKRSYVRWMNNIKEDQRKACNDAYRARNIDPFMPFTPDWARFIVETGLNSISGYIKDLFTEPLKVDGEPFDELPPTVILKDPQYGGGDAECFVTQAYRYSGMPLPGLSRYVYALDCTNDKSKKEGINGFVAVATSSKLTKITPSNKKNIIKENR